MPNDEYKATDLTMWGGTVDIHYGPDFYNVERFKAGETTLEDFERHEGRLITVPMVVEAYGNMPGDGQDGRAA
ncbi:MAG TPA: hypothetical protein EYQ82_08845 [Dehalococcoidia bacterium]|nr:hypothetical protein [Dehalococcoidia bacterium]